MERRERICYNRRMSPYIMRQAIQLLKEEQWSPQQISDLFSSSIEVSFNSLAICLCSLNALRTFFFPK
ncbi:MAG: hypothetical protein NC038_01740 [Paludibacter sp.]|nr:hypothetical protein [Bacteroidales bacterium]MCM1068932.1 hypothetical protein [Prevotella sp.]MCM1481358.1 hypothetical protein [Paludibacter sp.]MCM1575566.1 hypothetical protein [Bacteroides sp.]